MAGLVAGAVALVLAALFLPFFTSVPYGGILLNAALAWGAYSFLVHRDALLHQAGDAGIAAFLGYLGLPFLTRMVAHQVGFRLPLVLEFTIAFTVLAIAFAVGVLQALSLVVSPPRSAQITGVVGAAGFAALGAVAIATSPTRTVGGLALVGLTALLVPALLVLQWMVARRLPPRMRVWARGPALAVAATQLFDGIVTYLAVVDPLGLAPGEFHEQVPLSDLILRATGVGYPILKWALALAIGYALENHGWKSASKRIAFYLVLLAIGLGPALYSGSQLL